MSASRPRVAMVGTFDLGNFGDLLFPVLAKRELGRRLDGVELVPHSYRAMGASAWPYEVRSLATLEEELPEYDAMLLGGGHLVRFIDPYAPGYGPIDAGRHDPTGLWLEPTMSALAAGVRVVWSAIGVHGDTPDWALPLLRGLLDGIEDVAVRDAYSAELLSAAAPGTPVRTVPDTAFGAASLVPDVRTPAWRAFQASLARASGYVVLQASPALRAFPEEVRAVLAAAARAGLAVVEVPISPTLGDRCGQLELDGADVMRIETLPNPGEMVEIIGRAEAVIAQSLHLSIVAASCGVPVNRPKSDATEKYAVLDGLDAVRTWNADWEPQIGRSAPAQDVLELAGQVAGHWDRVAATVREAVGKGPRRPPRFLGELGPTLAQLSRLGSLEGELRAVRGKLEELELEHERVRARMGALQGEVDWYSRLGVVRMRRALTTLVRRTDRIS
jgi:lipopolysaccharide transport system ATP-binding protein